MPLFAVICRDKPGRLEARLATREAHLAWLTGSGRVQLAGLPVFAGAGAGDGLKGAACQRRSNNALATTLTELSAIAAPASTGLSSPNAASGTPIRL